MEEFCHEEEEEDHQPNGVDYHSEHENASEGMKQDDPAAVCDQAAEALQKVINYSLQHGQLEHLLGMYAHSATCPNRECDSMCHMWRRVRRHVIYIRHTAAAAKRAAA